MKSKEGKDVYGNNRYLNPTNDVSFKKLFGTEGHKDLLLSFLNSMLGLKGRRRIQQVELCPQELSSLFGEGKRSVLDVQCTDASGRRYIVEMQNHYAPDFIKRTQMYTSHAYVSQLGKGTQQLELSPVILLAITNHTVFPKKTQTISYHKMLDIETLEHDLKDISYVFIELSKFHKKDPADLKTIVDKWMYFFKFWQMSKSPPETITEPELLEAYDTMEKFNWDAVELDYYLKADIALAEQQKAKEEELQKGLKKGRKEGRKEGRIEGLEEGLEKGRIEGREEGLEEGRKEEREKAEQKQVTMVRGFLSQGVDITIIMQVTGMGKIEIEKIARALNVCKISA